jgi:hypothetical protein
VSVPTHRLRGRALAPLAAAFAAGLAGAPARAGAQGSLSVQGFGYPTGQFSTRVLGTGGALAEYDPVSPLNPAALLEFGRTFAAFQYDPEFRQLTAGSVSQRNTVSRFPVVAAGGPFARRRAMFALSASTFLDRTFSTTFPDTTQFSNESVATTERVESTGSISDVRLGVAYAVSRTLRVGLSGHVLTGENRLVSGREFADSARFQSRSDSTSVDYSGSAVTLGAELTPVRGVRVAGSYRRGGGMSTNRGDSTLTRASVPDRAGVALRVDRVPGAAIAVSYAHTSWSRMRGLGTAALEVHDASDVSAGVEAVGPRLGETPLLLRLGARRRGLPFGVGGAKINETSFGGGAGLPLGGGRALADVGVQRALRSATGGTAVVGGARERAWLLSVGFTVRPLTCRPPAGRRSARGRGPGGTAASRRSC